jgi:C1A family cysteine protease
MKKTVVLFIVLLTFLFLLPSVTAQSPLAAHDTVTENLTPGLQPGLQNGAATCDGCNAPALAGRLNRVEEDAKIQGIQDYIRKNNLSWTAGRTSVSNLTPAAFQARLGLKHPKTMTGLPVKGLSTGLTPDSATLPASFDWRNNGGDWTTPVKNQASCGSCWAFASTGTFESFWERLNNDPNLNPDFAEQYLVSCDTDPLNVGCDGGFSTALGSFVNRPGKSGGVGTVVESDYPYTATTGTCKSLAGMTRYTVPAGGSWNYLAGDCVVSSVESTKQAIYQYGPVNAYMYATDALSAYSGGIFEDPVSVAPCMTNHVIVLVGWGHDPVKNKDYWIAKNSWGTDWGESGWFRIYVDQCRVGEGVAYLQSPTLAITSFSPVSVYRNATMNYTITGWSFQPGNTSVSFRNLSGAYLNGTDAGVFMVTSTSINGSIHIPYNATTGAWNVSVKTPKGTVWRTAALTVNVFPKPVVSTILPASPWYRNATISYTITGSNFQPGNTAVTFWNKSGIPLNASSGAGVTSVTPTRINGTVVIPYNAPVNTPYNITVTTVDGGTAGKDAAFTVMQLPPPAIASLTPATGFKNSTVLFTLTGTNFQTTAGYTNITFQEVTGVKLYGSVTSITGTKISGTLAIPADAAAGPCDLMVTTVDGGTTTKESAFTISFPPLPTITSINQTAGFRNSTVPFLITGNNFQPGGGTWVRLYAPGVPQIDGALASVTGPTMTGTFTIPWNAATGKYRLDVFTVSGGGASRMSAFTVNPVPKPVIATVTPAQSYRNRTLIITVTGTSFQPSSGTYVNLTHPANSTDISVTLISVTPTRLNGSVTIPPDAPTTLLWKLNVTTIDGGRGTRPSAIAIQQYPAPTFGSITPARGNRSVPVAFTLKGTNFETGGTTVTFWNRTGNTAIAPTILSVSTTQVTGSVLFPADANQSWYVNISTVDWGTVAKEKAFTAV